MTADQLISEANLLLESGKPAEAIPYLKDYLARVAGIEDTRVLEMAQDVRFKLGAIMIQQNNPAVAAGFFEQYVNLRPALKWHDAMKFWATSLLELNRFSDCVRVTTNALAGPPSDVRKELDDAAALAAAESAKNKSPDGYEFDEYGEVIQKPAELEAVGSTNFSGYSQADLLVLNMTLGQAYDAQGLSEQSITPFTYVIEHTSNSVHKGYAIMQVVNGLIGKKDFERLTQWIPQLYRTDARYDIRVNLALMKAATALFEAEQYDNALPLFRMIMPRQELIAYQSAKIRELQIKAGIIPPDPVKGPYKTKVDETLFGKKYSMAVEEFWSEDDATAKVKKSKELIEIEQLVGTLESLPPYENEVVYRTARLYDEVHRPWEAARFFDRVYQADPGSDIGDRSFYDLIRILLDPLGQIKEAESRGLAYLGARKEGLTPRQIAYLLTGYYQQNEHMSEIKKLMPYIQGFVPSSDPAIRKYECELYYMQAVADMVMLNYELAEAGFSKVLKDFPGSHQEDNATYWHAATLLFLEKYETALIELNIYLDNFPDGAWRDSAYFQGGVCLFGLENYDEALAKFTTVIDMYPKSRVCPDACSLRGDIYGSRGQLDEAISDYQLAVDRAITQAQAKYATFQMAAVFEAESRYDEIIRVVNNYMDRYGKEADLAMGIYWIGKTRLNQGKVDDAVQAYVDAIIQYGSDLRQSGVDAIIAELVQVSRMRLSDVQRIQLKTRFQTALAESKNLTLRLRLRAALAQMDRTEVELGRQLISELPDLESAAPPVLSAICDASFAAKDYSRAEEILRMFTTKFDDSEYMRSAFKLRGSELFGAGKYDAALKLIADAQARYGTDYDVAWAQLMKGEILIKQVRYDEARKELADVFNVTGWRGESYAEAAYRLGQVEEAAGNPLKAHGWYQRTYVQYKGYDKGYWAAEAYLGSARCLKQLGYIAESRNTYRAMLFDKYVNSLPQAAEAVRVLGAEEVLEIKAMISSGVQTNIAVKLETEKGE